MSLTRVTEFKAHAPSQWRTKLKDDCIRRIKEERTALIQAARQRPSAASLQQTSSLTAIIDDQLSAARRRRDTNDIDCTPPPSQSQSASSHVNSPASSDSSLDSSVAVMSDGDDYDDVLSHDEYLILMSELQHVIDEEMQQSSFDDAVMYDEMDESSLEAEYESSVSASNGRTILCPVCRARYLYVKTHTSSARPLDKSTVTLTCVCGLNVATDDCSDALSVSDRLANELITHDAHCPSAPHFIIDRLSNNNQWQVQSSALNVSMSVRPVNRQMLRLICSSCQWNQPIKL